MKILRQGNSAIKTYYVEIAGTSSEEKPVKDVGAGSLFTETDTGDIYIFNEDFGWWEKREVGGPNTSFVVPDFLVLSPPIDETSAQVSCNMEFADVLEAINSGKCVYATVGMGDDKLICYVKSTISGSSIIFSGSIGVPLTGTYIEMIVDITYGSSGYAMMKSTTLTNLLDSGTRGEKSAMSIGDFMQLLAENSVPKQIDKK